MKDGRDIVRTARARAAVAAVALVALLPAAAGCGGKEEKFRKQDLNPLVERLDMQKARISATLRTVRLGSRRDSRLLVAQVKDMVAVQRKIAALKVPFSAADEFIAYNRANAKLSLQLRRFALALARKAPKTLGRIGRQAQDATSDARNTEVALKEALSK